MDNLIEFAKGQCEIFPEDSDMGMYLRETLKILQGEPCEDAVSRAELLKIYEDRSTELQKLKHLKDNKGAEDRQMGVNYCINILKELPPVTPTRKKGEWIKIGDRGFGWSDTVICKCSECEYRTEFRGKFDGQYLIVDQEHAHKYCPSCGIEMESKE